MKPNKRGSYFNYLQRENDSRKVKIPRQTLWNQRNKVLRRLFNEQL